MISSKNLALRSLNRDQKRVIAFTQLLFFLMGLFLLIFGALRIALEFGETLTGVNNEALKTGVANWFTGQAYTTPLVLLVGIVATLGGYGLLWATVALGAKEPPAWSAGYIGLIGVMLTLVISAGVFIWLAIRFLPVVLLVLLLLLVASVVLVLRFNQADFRLALGAERINRQGTPTYFWILVGIGVIGVSVLTVIGLVYAVLTDIIELELDDVPEGDLIYLSTFDSFNDEWDIERATDSYTSAIIEPDDNGNLRLVMTMTPDADQGIFTLLNRKVRNFDLRVTTTQLASDPFHDNVYGIIFGYRDDETFYQFQISGDGYYRLLKISPNSDDSEAGTTETEISTWRGTTAPDEDFEFNNTNPTLIRPGSYNPINTEYDTRNEIRVVVRQQQFSFFINGEPVPLCLKGSRGNSMWVGEGCVEGNVFTYTFKDGDYRQGQIGFLINRTARSDPNYPVSIAFDNIVLVGPPTQLDLPIVGGTNLP